MSTRPAVPSDPVDLRLATGATAAWVATAVTLSRPSVVALIVAIGCGVLGAGLLAARAGPHLMPVCVAAFCVALALLPLSARLIQARAGPLAGLARDQAAVTADLQITSDPVPIAASSAAAARVGVDADLLSARWAGRATNLGGGHLVVFAAADSWQALVPGERVRADVRLSPASSGDLLSAVAAAQSSPTIIRAPPWWQRAATTVRTSLRSAAGGLPPQPRGLLPGLVDGDTSGLDPILAERFRIAGLTHLIAVSGTNCAIIVGAALLVLRRFRAGPVACAIVGGVILLGFVVVARPSPSVLRAAVMAAIALVGLAAGRPRSVVPMLAAAVLGLLLWRPTLATDAGFTMSVLATAALLVVAPGWAMRLRRRWIPPVVAEAVAVAAAAHVVTAPVVAAISGRVSLVAIPANVLAEPVVAVTTVAGFGAALTAPVVMPVAQVLAFLAGWPCRWLVTVGSWFGGLPGAALPWPSGIEGALILLLVTLCVVVLARRPRYRVPLVAVAATALVVQIPARSLTSGWPPAGEVFVACDVGQGDALVLPVGAGSAVVVDTGPDPVAVDRCLRDQNIREVRLLVLTHYHLDHVGGIVGVLHDRWVRRVIVGPLDEPLSGVRLVAAALRPAQLVVERATPGASFHVGDVTLDVLGPARAFHGTRSDPNNSSVVMRATVRGVRVLLAADAEIEAQQQLLATGVDLRADVLKVPHHGSAYSDPAFLAAVGARVGIISVGAHNDYGHPAPSLLARLDRLGLVVRRTDRDGDVGVTVVDGRVGTSVRRPDPAVAAANTEPLVTIRLASEARATMSGCSTPPGNLGPARVRPARCRTWSSWSATRNSWCPAPSSRSPPPSADSIRGPTSTSARAPGSRRVSCSIC